MTYTTFNKTIILTFGNFNSCEKLELEMTPLVMNKWYNGKKTSNAFPWSCKLCYRDMQEYTFTYTIPKRGKPILEFPRIPEWLQTLSIATSALKSGETYLLGSKNEFILNHWPSNVALLIEILGG